MTNQKISITFGGIAFSVETEGNDAVELLRSSFALARENLSIFGTETCTTSTTPRDTQPAPTEAASREAIREGTLNVVAAKFGSGSGREILWAAAVYFTFYQGKARWTREEWMAAAKEARDWKALYSSGAARDIARMVKGGEINEVAADVFSLPTNSLAEIEGKLE